MKRPRSEKAKFFAKLLAEQQASGMPVTAFARQRGVVPNLFFWWRAKLRRLDARDREAAKGEIKQKAKRGKKGTKKPVFLPVHVVEPGKEESLRPSGRESGYSLTVKGVALTLPERFDVDRVVALVRGLASC